MLISTQMVLEYVSISLEAPICCSYQIFPMLLQTNYFSHQTQITPRISNAFEVIYAMNACTEIYRQVSNIRRTKSQHLKDPRTVLRLPLPNPLKPDVKSRMKI